MYANTSSRVPHGELALYHFNHRITEHISRPFLQKCRLGQLSPTQMIQIYPQDIIEGQAVLVFTFSPVIASNRHQGAVFIQHFNK